MYKVFGFQIFLEEQIEEFFLLGIKWFVYSFLMFVLGDVRVFSKFLSFNCEDLEEMYLECLFVIDNDDVEDYWSRYLYWIK